MILIKMQKSFSVIFEVFLRLNSDLLDMISYFVTAVVYTSSFFVVVMWTSTFRRRELRNPSTNLRDNSRNPSRIVGTRPCSIEGLY